VRRELLVLSPTKLTAGFCPAQVRRCLVAGCALVSLVACTSSCSAASSVAHRWVIRRSGGGQSRVLHVPQQVPASAGTWADRGPGQCL